MEGSVVFFVFLSRNSTRQWRLPGEDLCFGIIMTLLRYRRCPVIEHMELEVVSFLFLEVFNQKLVDSWHWIRVGVGTLVVCL